MKIIIHLTLVLFIIQLSAQESIEVYFDFNKEYPNSESEVNLIKWIEENKNIKIIEFSGYCDSIDKSDYNKKLSLKRILSVENIFNKHEIQIDSLVVRNPYGKDFEQNEIQSLNRKVSVSFLRLNEKLNTIESENEVVKEPELSLKEKFSKAQIGDLIKIENINFQFNSDVLMKDSYSKIEELLIILKENNYLKVEIQGHICCNPDPNDTKLSYKRAKAVLKYLVKGGVDKERLQYIGFGSSKPIFKIPEKNHQESVANRRVEILILEK